LAESCYSYMFYGCTNLNYIKCLARNVSANNCTSRWVENVQTNSGTFVRNENTNWGYGINGIPSGWNVIPPLEEEL